MIRCAWKSAGAVFGFGLLAALVACSGTPGADGAQGAEGEPGAPGKVGEPGPGPSSSVSLVTPAMGLLDREIEVSIGGSQTRFDPKAKPDFGPGIEVLDVVASSPTLLTARLRIARDAQVGPRTVKIGDVVAKDAFTVAPAIEVQGLGGKAKVGQGAFVQLAIDNNDGKAFDTNAFQLFANGLLDLGSSATGPQAASGLLLAPPLAKTGALQLEVQNLGPDGKPRMSFLSAPDALTVEARTADAFTLDKAAEQSFASAFDSKLFKLSTAAGGNAIVDYRIEVPQGGKALPVAFLFGTGGQLDDELGRVLPQQNPFTGQFNPPPYDLRITVPVLAGQAAVDHYLVLADLAGQTGAKATVTATRTNAFLSAESANLHPQNAHQAIGQVAGKDGRLVKARLEAQDEIDAYSFSVDPAAKLQLTISSDADLEVVVTKDVNVLADAQNAADKKVVAKLYPGKKFAAQKIVANPGVGELFVVVRSDAEGKVATGAYTLGARLVP